ncbi:MAG: helix-turn-helix domain-containing protein [Candidatus Contendobacter sp.]|nr:MAG: helix-turn-helix domain-containing protein [Candidatus Contendobacter sp.]
MSALERVSGGFLGIGGGESPPKLHDRAETLLQTLLRVEGIAARAVYRPGEVCRLLRISPTTLRQFCDLAEHPAVQNPDPRALDSFLVGCHRRISHAALVEWLVRNQKFQREG